MKTFELVEDIHVQLLPDAMGAMEPNAYVGQRITLNERRAEIVANSHLTWTIRYLSIWERLQEWWQIKKN